MMSFQEGAKSRGIAGKKRGLGWKGPLDSKGSTGDEKVWRKRISEERIPSSASRRAVVSCILEFREGLIHEVESVTVNWIDL